MSPRRPGDEESSHPAIKGAFRAFISVSPIKEYIKELTDTTVKQRLRGENRNNVFYIIVMNKTNDKEQFIYVKLMIWSLRLTLQMVLIWVYTGTGLLNKTRNMTSRDGEIMNIMNQLDPIGKSQHRKLRASTDRTLRIVLDVIRFDLD